MENGLIYPWKGGNGQKNNKVHLCFFISMHRLSWQWTKWSDINQYKEYKKNNMFC